MSWAAIGVAVLLLGVLTLVSYVERIYAEMGKFLAREFQENVEIFETRIEPRLGVGRNRASLSMAVLAQLTTASIALVLAYFVFRDGLWDFRELTQAAVTLVFVVIVFNRIIPFVFFTRTRGEFLLPLVPVLRVLIYLVFPITMVLGFSLSVAALAEEKEPQQPENASEAVDALIEAGEEEGILQESDRELIQSVVEFGEKTVREVMTPRPEIVAVPLNETVEHFTELLRTKPYSRVPVFDQDIDHIKGIVFAHDVLQVPDAEARTRTVENIMKPVHFVPETKQLSLLLREMQRENLHLSIVIDEYGSVAGIVTIEDLVEEIVGEIRDEHEAKADIVREDPNSYVVPGSMDVDRVPVLFGVRPEVRDASTVGGLVSELMGRIPEPGAVVEEEGLRFEVLEATDRRIERLRISRVPVRHPAEPRPLKAQS